METRRNNWSYKLIIRIGCSYIHYYTLMYNLCITVPEGSTNSEYWFSATKFIHLPTWHEEWIGTWQQPFEITGNNNFQGYVKATKKRVSFHQPRFITKFTDLIVVFECLLQRVPFVNSNFRESLYPFWAKNLLRQEWLSNIYLSL